MTGESFTLDVEYKNQHLQLPAQLQVFGYSHKIAVTINDGIVLFEPDESGSYRAVLTEPDKQKNVDVHLLQAIAEILESNLQ
jgi:hypothetical protein